MATSIVFAPCLGSVSPAAASIGKPSHAYEYETGSQVRPAVGKAAPFSSTCRHTAQRSQPSGARSRSQHSCSAERRELVEGSLEAVEEEGRRLVHVPRAAGVFPRDAGGQVGRAVVHAPAPNAPGLCWLRPGCFLSCALNNSSASRTKYLCGIWAVLSLCPYRARGDSRGGAGLTPQRLSG